MGKIFNLSGILIISGNFDKKNGHPVEEFTNNGCIRTFVNISFFFIIPDGHFQQKLLIYRYNINTTHNKHRLEAGGPNLMTIYL